MENKSQKKRHGKLAESTFSFEVPGESIIALHNAISFTMAHHDEYIREGDDCDHCLEAMHVLRKSLSRIIDHAGAYQLLSKKKKLN